VAWIDQVGGAPDGLNVVLLRGIDVGVVVGVGDGIRGFRGAVVDCSPS